MKELQIREDLNRIECINNETNENNKGLKAYAMKQIAKNFFKGVTNFSLPAYVFEPVSNVSQFINNFRTAPYFMQKAIYINFSEPYERIKLITSMCVSSLHQNISFKRAFNPILGETYEGFFTVDEDEFERECNIGKGLSIGFDVKKNHKNFARQLSKTELRNVSKPTAQKNKFINVFVEQTSHHPPLTNFLLEHFDRVYKIYGYIDEVFKQSGSTLEFRTKGKTIIEFKDGDKYSITWPAKIFENNVFMKYEEYIRIEQLRTPYTITRLHSK